LFPDDASDKGLEAASEFHPCLLRPGQALPNQTDVLIAIRTPHVIPDEMLKKIKLRQPDINTNLALVPTKIFPDIRPKVSLLFAQTSELSIRFISSHLTKNDENFSRSELTDMFPLK